MSNHTEFVIISAEDLKNLLVGSQDYINRAKVLLANNDAESGSILQNTALRTVRGLEESQERCLDAYAKTGVWFISPHYAEAFLKVIKERRHQIVDKGWTPEHDKEHERFEIAYGALTYLKAYTMLEQGLDIRNINKTLSMMDWPFLSDTNTFKAAGNPVDNLVKAIAMLLAELERRLAEPSNG